MMPMFPFSIWLGSNQRKWEWQWLKWQGVQGGQGGREGEGGKKNKEVKQGKEGKQCKEDKEINLASEMEKKIFLDCLSLTWQVEAHVQVVVPVLIYHHYHPWSLITVTYWWENATKAQIQQLPPSLFICKIIFLFSSLILTCSYIWPGSAVRVLPRSASPK